MIITIHSIPTQILLQTVELAFNKKDPDNSYLFRCYHCGTAITRVKGKIVGITAGYVPSNEVPVIYRCYGCKENYTFTTVKPKKDTIRLTLVPEVGRLISTFHCVVCRTPLLQYESLGDRIIVTELPIQKQWPLPFEFTCMNPTCHQQYLLNEVVNVV